jgi:hypothetical protein
MESLRKTVGKYKKIEEPSEEITGQGIIKYQQ